MPATSISTGRRGGCGAGRATFISDRPSSGSSNISWKSRAGVFSRAQLLDGVWGQAAEIDERTVDVHVGRLRKALSRGRERDPIRTVRGTGYAFDETFGKT